MKWIMASIVTLLLCNGSLAYAQPAKTGGTPISSVDPAVFVKSMSAEEREKFVLDWKKAQSPNMSQDELEKFKQVFEKMSQDQQQRMTVEAVAQWQQYFKKYQENPELNRVTPSSIRDID